MAMKTRGAVVESWQGMNALGLYGVKPAASVNTTAGPDGDGLGGANLETSASASLLERSTGKPWHPDSPLFWFGLLMATTFGLIAGSTSIRVGPFKAGVSAGKS